MARVPPNTSVPVFHHDRERRIPHLRSSSLLFPVHVPSVNGFEDLFPASVCLARLRRPRVQRDAGNLVAAPEVLDMAGHPRLGLAGVALAQGFHDAALCHHDA